MATIYARGAVWYLNWSQNGRQHRQSLGAVTKDEAEKFRKAKQVELRTGQRIFLASARFEDHLDRYVSWHAVKFRDSHFRVKQICEQCFTDFYGKGLSQITTGDIETWLTGRLQRVGWNRKYEEAVVSSETAAKELRTLKAVLNKAVEWGELERSPAKSIENPKNLRSEPIEWFSRAELNKLYKVNTFGPHYGHIWRLMANTGLRRAEAFHVEWTHIDHKQAVMRILSTEDSRTKSGKWRQVPLSAGATAALRALKRVTGKGVHVLPRTAPQTLSRAFRADADALGLTGSLHGLRHSYAAHLILGGVPLRALQTLMGHASFTTTEKYGFIGADVLRDQARAISL